MAELKRKGTGKRIETGWVTVSVRGTDNLRFVEELAQRTGKTPRDLVIELLNEAIHFKRLELTGSLSGL